MEVVIRGKPQNLDVSTLTFKQKANVTTSVHCPSCGGPITVVGGDVSKIYPYYEPTDQLLIIDKCKTCGRRFTFQSYDTSPSEKIRVILRVTGDLNDFWCIGNHEGGKNCKILEYTPQNVFTIVDKKRHLLPFATKCYMNSCDKQYWFAEII